MTDACPRLTGTTTTHRVTADGIQEAVTLTVIETAGARVLAGHTGAVNSVAFSPDGARLSTASEDKTARVWNAATGELLHTLAGHDDAVFAAPFSPDGAMIATVSADLTPRLWDAAHRCLHARARRAHGCRLRRRVQP